MWLLKSCNNGHPEEQKARYQRLAALADYGEGCFHILWLMGHKGKFLRVQLGGNLCALCSGFNNFRFPFRYGLDRLLSRLCQDKRSCNEAYSALQAGIGSTYECADLCLSFYK